MKQVVLRHVGHLVRGRGSGRIRVRVWVRVRVRARVRVESHRAKPLSIWLATIAWLGSGLGSGFVSVFGLGFG